ncbi:hypothetical protein SCLCIDRAFT_638321 [Scleroderma citrinum Foug A]|uniref:Uncharacterized protein n=1 Tax=Scleroderma citrinum Foug A TaxID=1036808 RepID=A0A0C2YNZ9_9AGAM|nr:hypothetical protein SCLCIDRAFT_638321 [Scleroderma citrinum Foug A]
MVINTVNIAKKVLLFREIGKWRCWGLQICQPQRRSWDSGKSRASSIVLDRGAGGRRS